MSSIILGGNGQAQISLDLKMANRHGLIAGATGTGKTVSLQTLSEQFSTAGVPVFMVDAKGDLSGLACEGAPHPKITERLNYIGNPSHGFASNPVVFWDVFGKSGQPIRTTVSEIGPLLLANLLELNDTQTGVLYATFKIADERGLLLLDLDDLVSMLNHVGDNAKALKAKYGNISASSVGAIQRRLMVLDEQGFGDFLGEPALEIPDLMQLDMSGKGFMNIFDVSRLIHKSPKLYATVLLWLLSEVFETLPEAGDLDKPKFVMFFDEAHLLFDGVSKSLVDKIEQVVRLIRSKSVGVYFISQSPLDIPEDIAGQLGLKIQHALRAFTPKDKKMISSVAESFRPNSSFNTEDVITSLGMGEALVSTLNQNGSPTEVERTLMSPPMSRIGAASESERQTQMSRSPTKTKYTNKVNRESAHEMLVARANAEQAKSKTSHSSAKQKSRSRQSVGESFMKSISRAIGSQIGRQLVRGVLGSLFKR
ncbi:helicase HerA-like domain-containing protein [Ningiella sp. W23]|uniref:helicase HerA-like domain-containing protein n=1 Tax=Ningiella sp. W23 TaxID=3023715 RepID=UPI0037570AD7